MFYNMDDYRIELDKLGKVIIYLRKSREDLIDGRYASDEETLARHEGQLQEWAKYNLGHEIPQEDIYKEVVSGEKISDRPVFQEVLSKLETEDIDAVLVVNISRLSRGDMGDCHRIITSFKLTDTYILSPQKCYNLKSKYDERFLKDELTRGSDYLETVKELLANGRHWSVSRGKFIGSKPPYSYDRVSCKELGIADGKGFTLVPNENAKYVKLIFELYLEGKGRRAIAKTLHDIGAPLYAGSKSWSETTIRNILDNVTYAGKVHWKKRETIETMVNGEVIRKKVKQKEYTIYDGLHEAIIPMEVYEQAKEITATHEAPKTTFERTHQNPLATFVKCGMCGRVMTRQNYKKTTLKRKYDLDKVELKEFLYNAKNESKLSNSEIAKRLNVSKHFCNAWFGKDVKYFYPTEIFSNKWYEIKKVLNITTKKFDKAITEYEEVKKPAVLSCSTSFCENIGVNLDVVEDMIINEVKKRYENYNYFLDNYEEEYKKKISSNKKSVTKIEKDIQLKETQLKNSRIAFEQGADTLEEYIARKKELLNELEVLKEDLKIAMQEDEEEKIITIKKSLPILKQVFDKYYNLDPQDRNELLKSVINRVLYVKTKTEDNDSIELDIDWLI